MKIFNLILVTATLACFLSCGDDDYSEQLDYTICGNEIVNESDQLSQVNLELGDWPTEIRSYFSSEFSGYSIASILTYENVNKDLFYLLKATNGGQLLFNDSLDFICGDATFRDESGIDDEHIAPEDLPKVILDFIETNYPGIGIKDAEFDDGEYDIELNNGKQLCFRQDGTFKGEC